MYNITPQRFDDSFSLTLEYSISRILFSLNNNIKLTSDWNIPRWFPILLKGYVHFDLVIYSVTILWGNVAWEPAGTLCPQWLFTIFCLLSVKEKNKCNKFRKNIMTRVLKAGAVSFLHVFVTVHLVARLAFCSAWG